MTRQIILVLTTVALVSAGAVQLSAQARAAARPPSSPSYDQLVAAARAFLRASNAEEAIGTSEKAIQLDGRRWEAYVTAASGYATKELYDDAIGMLQLALVRAPEDRKPLIRTTLTQLRVSASTGGGAASNAHPSSDAAQEPAGNKVAAPTQAEVVLWKAIENSERSEDYQAYLSQYPNGTFSALASARLTKLEEKAAAEAKRQLAEQAAREQAAAEAKERKAEEAARAQKAEAEAKQREEWLAIAKSGRKFRVQRLNYVGQQDHGLYFFPEVVEMWVSGTGIHYWASKKGGGDFTLRCIDTFSRSLVSLEDSGLHYIGAGPAPTELLKLQGLEFLSLDVPVQTLVDNIDGVCGVAQGQ